MSPAITIVGSSARAAAQSAARSGFSVYAADLFADIDLQSVAVTTQISDYPRGLGRLIEAQHDGGWLYTGALENHPDLIDAWSKKRPLFGNRGTTLRAVRDPTNLAQLMSRHGLPFPPIRFAGTDVPDDGTWLRKPQTSAGGLGIERWRGSGEISPACYFQQEIPGTPHSALFVANGHQSALIGVTEQLIGCRWAGAEGFRYCGSVGPVDLRPEVRQQVQEIGRTLTTECGLQGLFGIDMVLDSRGAWLVEVNPRYTASAEVLEHATNQNLIELHIRACHDHDLPNVAQPSFTVAQGKAIVFAEQDCVIPDSLEISSSSMIGALRPKLADIPCSGAHIQRGWPIMTVHVESTSRNMVMTRLQEACTMVRHLCSSTSA